MLRFPIDIFTTSPDFPFHIQYGHHEGENCYIHGHEDFSELVIVLEGSAQHIVEDQSYPIAKGDVFVIDKYTEHGFTEARNLKICNIMFRPEVIFENIYDIRHTSGFQALFVLEPHYNKNHQFCSRLCLQSGDFFSVVKAIEEIMEEYNQKNEAWQTLVYTKFIELCVALSKFYKSYQGDNKNNIIKLAEAIVYIEKNFCEEISVSQLAQISGYSQRQFSRLFQFAFSVTPMGYITKLRLQKAEHLLKNTALSVGEVSWHCGYDDQNYFSRIFKKNIGISPTEFKNLYQ